jgi:glycerol-3-phosphate acyltransferase PlsY
MLIAFALVLVLFGFVGLATMTSVLMVSLYVLWIGTGFSEPLLFYTTTMALYLIYTHRSNLKRMLAGDESRNKKVMIFSRK